MATQHDSPLGFHFTCLWLHHGRRGASNPSYRSRQPPRGTSNRHGRNASPGRPADTRPSWSSFSRILRGGRAFYRKRLHVFTSKQHQSKHSLLLTFLVDTNWLGSLLRLELAIFLAVTEYLSVPPKLPGAWQEHVVSYRHEKIHSSHGSACLLGLISSISFLD